MANPHIQTELPGPNARAMLARDLPVASPSYPRDYPFVMSHGRGVEVWDVDLIRRELERRGLATDTP